MPRQVEEEHSLRKAAAHARDPVSGQSYDYRRVDEKSFELCAVFDRESSVDRPRPSADFWLHRTGRHCFVVKVREVPR